MDKIKIKIDGRIAEIESAPEVVTDNAEYEVEFAVDERDGWNPTVPMTALFVRRDARYTAVVMDVGETICTMPPQTGTNVVYIGLTQEEMRTTTPARIPIRRSVRTMTDFPPLPDKDVYAQILANFAELRMLSGKGAPTTETAGKVNQLYRDETNNRLYVCVNDVDGYTWAMIGGGGGGGTVVTIDTTLTKSGQAADAKAVGDAIEKKLDATALPTAINDALAQAKASGAFDGAPGADGKTPVYGVDYGTPEQIVEIAQDAAEVLQPEVDKLKDDIAQIDTDFYTWVSYNPLYKELNKSWNLVVNNWFAASGSQYSIVPADVFHGHLRVKSAWVNKNVPAVCYFSSDTPSVGAYLGCDGRGASGTVEQIENVECNIPEACTHVVLQGYYTVDYSLMEFESVILSTRLPIQFFVSNGVIEVKTVCPVASTFAHGTETIVKFGKRGPNQLPDFNEIVSGTDVLNANTADWHSPFMIKANANEDGDDPTTQTFTGGNHNYKNTGTMDSTPTARNLSLKYIADGRVVYDGDSGYAAHIEIRWKNRVQAYNTRKADGSGREVLEERHVLMFDGVRWESTVEIEPLEAITCYSWYGFQMSMPYGVYSNFRFIGGTDRNVHNRTDNANAGNKIANGINVWGKFVSTTLEIDRTYDVGDASLVVSDEGKGVFTSDGKAYTLIGYYKTLTANSTYAARALYRFGSNL